MAPQRRSKLTQALVAVVAAGAAIAGLAAGCEGTRQAGTPAGSPTGSAGGGSGGTDGQGGAPCNAPADGYCDGIEDCHCVLCAVAAVCAPFGCLADGWCNPPIEDSCTCSDCDWDETCLFLDGANCLDDGVCEYQSEGCACPDCHDVPSCLDNAAQCAGGIPDGQCEPELEPCDCLDCLGAEACLCADDCDDSACVCPSCWGDSWCDDPDYCWNDGVCDWLWLESCGCEDCAPLPICAGYTGAGGAGGGA